MLMIDATIANIALPTLAQDLAVADSKAVLVVTVYQLILAMTLMPLAALGDRIGHRRLYCAGLILHSVGAALVFFVDSLYPLIVVRALQAVGTATALSVAVALLRATYPNHQLGKGMAINTIANASGTAMAPVLGGFILSVVSWHWVFAAAIPFSMISLALNKYLPDTPKTQKSFDGLGALLCAATFGLVIGSFEFASHGGGGLSTIALLFAGIIVAIVFIRHEQRVDQPVLPVDLLTQAPLARALTANFAAVVASMILLLYLPFTLQQQFGFGPAAVGGLLSAYAFTSVIVAPTSGYLSDKISASLLSSIGLSIATLGLIGVLLLPDAPSTLQIMWRLWLCGAGFGMFFSPNAKLMIISAPHARAAAAGSMVTTSRMLGQAIGATIIAGLLALGLGTEQAPIIISLVLVIVAASLCYFGLARERQAKQ